MKSLTEKQKSILDFIENFQEAEGMAPSVAEISEHFGIKSSTAFAHLKALERKKELSRSSKARSINLSRRTAGNMSLFSGALIIPLLGRVNAGIPSESMEFKEDDICINRNMLPHVDPENLFALRVQGESMRDLGILDGDIIIVEQQSQVKAGDIVVALVNNEVTVKTFYRKNDTIELHPANPDFKVQTYHASEVILQGKVVFLQRPFF